MKHRNNRFTAVRLDYGFEDVQCPETIGSVQIGVVPQFGMGECVRGKRYVVPQNGKKGKLLCPLDSFVFSCLPSLK